MKRHTSWTMAANIMVLVTFAAFLAGLAYIAAITREEHGWLREQRCASIGEDASEWQERYCEGAGQ